MMPGRTPERLKRERKLRKEDTELWLLKGNRKVAGNGKSKSF